MEYQWAKKIWATLTWPERAKIMNKAQDRGLTVWVYLTMYWEGE